MRRDRLWINLDAFMDANGISTEEMSNILGVPKASVSTIRGRGYVYDPETIQLILDQDRGWDRTHLFQMTDPDDMRYDAAIYRLMLKERNEKIIELTKKVAALSRALDVAGVNYKK